MHLLLIFYPIYCVVGKPLAQAGTTSRRQSNRLWAHARQLGYSHFLKQRSCAQADQTPRASQPPYAYTNKPRAYAQRVQTGPVHRFKLTKHRCQHSSAYKGSQQGAGSVEFLVMAIPLIFLALGTFDVARWMAERQVLGLALQEAGRAGVVSHASPQAMRIAFEHAARALFVAPDGKASQRRVRQFAQTLSNAARTPPWQIEILSPSAAAYRDFSHTKSPVPMAARHSATPPSKINNYYLAEQNAHYRRIWGADGRGPESGMNIFEANTLSLRLRYAYAPRSPGVKPLLRTVAESSNPYSRQLFSHGYLPIRRDMAMMMHSHPGLWPLPANGSFIRPSGTENRLKPDTRRHEPSLKRYTAQ